jgi:hypothetical protein
MRVAAALWPIDSKDFSAAESCYWRSQRPSRIARQISDVGINVELGCSEQARRDRELRAQSSSRSSQLTCPIAAIDFCSTHQVERL